VLLTKWGSGGVWLQVVQTESVSECARTCRLCVSSLSRAMRIYLSCRAVALCAWDPLVTAA
jgi:hypothetical protein